jgi:hypothetical protein
MLLLRPAVNLSATSTVSREGRGMVLFLFQPNFRDFWISRHRRGPAPACALQAMDDKS